LYSIEEICESVIAAGSAAAFCRTEQEFLSCALQAAGDLLDVSCCVFYPAATSAFDHVGTVRVNQRAGSELAIPEALPVSFSDHIRRQPGRLIVASDWDALGKLLPTFDFSCCASLWINIGNEDGTLGTLAFFDHASRRFERTQQRIAELLANVIMLGLESQAARRNVHSSEAATYQEFSKVVGTVARDLINPLTAIFGYIELLKMEPSGARSVHLIGRMEEQIEKARRVIATFSGASTEISRARIGEISVPAPKSQFERSQFERPLVPEPKRPELPIPTAWQPETLPTASKILLVQRSEAVLEFQRSVLGALGAEVIPALSARDALDHLRERELDGIILDDELEEPLSSKRLVWWVRENRPELSERMLLTVSRKPSQETREILEIAMLPHVTKPLEVLELYSRAQQMLQSGRHPHLLQ
jgi:CheY-like chemotaxis protein